MNASFWLSFRRLWINSKAVFFFPLQLILCWFLVFGYVFLLPQFWIALYVRHPSAFYYLFLNIFVVFCFYIFWGFLFPKYVIIAENGVGICDGRVYWHSDGNKETKMGYSEKDHQYFYVNRNMILNIFHPWASLTRVYIPKKCSSTRKMRVYEVVEPSYRYTDEQGDIYCSGGKMYENIINNKLGDEVLHTIVSDAVGKIQEVSHGNPESYRKVLEQSSAMTLSPEIRRRIDERKKRR